MTTRREEHDAVSRFSFHMLNKLRANADKGHWEDDSLVELVERVQEELDELKKEIARERRRADGNRTKTHLNKIIAEAADVANMAMMIADNCEADIRYMGEEQ